MSQLLKKYALLAACAVLALCFITRPAHAQTLPDPGAAVAPGGTGEHLLFAYWSTANYTNTHVNIHSPLGKTASSFSDPKNVVYVRVRTTAPDRNVVVSFNICLLPGDTWTAALSMDGLMVMDEGGCDGDLQELSTANLGHQNLEMAPMMEEMVDLGEADSGYIEAWLNPGSTLQDDTGVQEPDGDLAPDDANPRNISGTASLVSPMSGFSSSYNATAFVGCRIVGTDGDLIDTDDTTADVTEANAIGCWVRDDNDNVDVPAATATTQPLLQRALEDQKKDWLTGRWTAIYDDNVMSHTKIVLTFPENHLNRADGSGPDPISIHVLDDMGGVALADFGLSLGMGVNTCMIGMMGDDMMGDDMMGDDMMMTMLSCNDEEIGEIDAMSGEFRIFNNTMAEDGKVKVPESPTAVVPAEPLSAIGLVFSYFEGTDGNQYDQVTDLQWIDVDDTVNVADTAANEQRANNNLNDL